MPSHVALLRGVNVGGRNRVPMADLRAAAAALDCREVDTYLQSGNLVYRPGPATPADLAAALTAALAERLGVPAPVVVVDAAELAAVVDANPFPGVAEPKALHAVFLETALTADQAGAVQAAAGRARQRGGRDELRVAGRVLYLHTPDGLGRSELAARLARPSGDRPVGTARNWATVTALHARLAG